MKRILLLATIVVLCMPLLAQRNIRNKRKKNNETTTISIGDYIKNRREASHWSIMGSVGASLLNGDQQKTANSPQYFYKISGLLNVEYTINPAWGIYLEYLYNPYEGYSRYVNQNISDPTKQIVAGKEDLYNYKGVNNEFTLGTSINILNLFYNCRYQKWQWYANIGAGISFFNMQSHSLFPNNDFGSDQLEVVPSKAHTLTIPIGTTLEWNANSWLAVVANIQYRFHSADNYDASIIGSGNDKTIFAGLGLRWKITNSTKNNQAPKHFRDMSMCQFEPNIAAEYIKNNGLILGQDSDKVQLKQQIADLSQQVKTLEMEINKFHKLNDNNLADKVENEANTPKEVIEESVVAEVKKSEPKEEEKPEVATEEQSSNPEGVWEITWNIPGAVNNNVQAEDNTKSEVEAKSTDTKTTAKNTKTSASNKTATGRATNKTNIASNNVAARVENRPANNNVAARVDNSSRTTTATNNRNTARIENRANTSTKNIASPKFEIALAADNNESTSNKTNTTLAKTSTSKLSNAKRVSNSNSSCMPIYYSTSKHSTQDAEDAKAILAEVARRLAANSQLLIQIKAYADEQGDDVGFDNQKLTEVRAQETKDILMKEYNVDESRIVLCKGFGSVKGAPSVDYQPNRRTDICFVRLMPNANNTITKKEQ